MTEQVGSADGGSVGVQEIVAKLSSEGLPPNLANEGQLGGVNWDRLQQLHTVNGTQVHDAFARREADWRPDQKGIHVTLPDDGFVPIEGVFDPELADALTVAIDEVGERPYPDRIEAAHHDQQFNR